MNASSPTQAVDLFTEALRRKDLEACVGLKGFAVEAQMILENRKKKYPDEVTPADFITRVASLLEDGFRKEKAERGFPDLAGVTWQTTIREEIAPDQVIVSQAFTWSDGTQSEENLLVAKTTDGWRVLIPPRKS